MFIKEIVIPKLLDKLANAIDTDKSGAASALGALGEKNKEVIEALVNALLHEQYPITREHAAQALGEIGVVNDEVVEALAKGLKAQHNEVRMGCLEAVAKLDLKQEVVRDALIHLVKMRGGEDWHCRKAAGILAEHEFDKTELINELYERTKVRDFQTQQRAVIALGKLAINNEKVIKRLIEIINIWLMNTLIIRDTAFAFCNMEKGDKRVSDALINYLEEERGDDIAKSGILRALGVQSTLGVKDTRTRKHALKQLKSDHYKDSGAICLGLLGEKDEEVINALFDCAVSDASMWARSRAIDALGYLEVEDEKIITKLKKMVATEEDDDVLKSIMDVLKHLDKVKGDVEDRVDEGVRQTIETRVDPGQGLGAMKVVADCLVKISNDDEKTVRLLFDALSKDFSAYDKEKIARALRKILRPDILPDGDELLKVFDKNNALSGLQSSGSARGRVNFDLDDILRPDRITPLSVPEDPIELLQILTDGQGGGVPLLVDTLAEIFASDNKHKFLNIMDLSYLPDVLRRIIYDEETLDEMIRLEIKDRANGSLGSKGFIRMAEVDEHIEQKVFNALITADNDKDKQGAIGILEGIGLRNERIMDSLIMMMRGEKSFTVRRALILMFWRIKNPNEALIRELTFMAANDEDHYIRQTAVGALAKLGKDDAEVKNILFRRLGNEESPEVKVTIARNLAEVFKIKNDEIVAILEESLLKEESGFSRERLARVLRDMDALSDDYVQRLLNIVFTEVNKDKKKNALFVLAEAGIQNEKVIKDLCDKVPTYDDPKVVAALMAVLGKSGIKTETVMKRLLESLNDERGIDVRDTAMRAIIKLELTDKRVIDTLIGNISNTEGTSVYKTQDHAYRLAELSAFALGKLGIKTESVTQALLNSCKNDKRYRVAEASAVALNELGIKSDELIDILIEKIEERDYFMQGPAAQVLGMIGRKDKKVVDALLEALQADVRAEAKSLIVHALDELEAEGDEVEKVLVGLIDSKEPVMVREVAVFGLQNILKRWIKPNVRDLEEAVSRNVARLQAALLGKTAEGSAEKRIAFDLDGILRPERIIPTQVPENPADLFMFLTQGVDHEFDGLREVIRDLLSQPDQIHLLAYLDLSWLPESVMDIIIKDYVINEMADRLGETGDLMSEYVKNRFIWALGEFGIKNDKVVEALKYRAMHDNESSVIGSAIRALATLNLDEDEIKDFLYDLFIHNEEDSVRDPVCMALSKLGLTDERIIKICLAKMAEHPDDIHEQIKRKHMTGYVSHAGRGDPRVIQALINGLLHDDDTWMRHQCAYGLNRMGSTEDDVLNALIHVIKDKKEKDDRLRGLAVEGIAKLGIKDDKGVNILIRVLRRDRSIDVRSGAAYTLGILRINTDKCIQLLLKNIKSKNGSLRAWCAWALGRSGVKTPEVIDALYKVLSEQESNNSASFTAGALEELNANEERVVDLLLKKIASFKAGDSLNYYMEVLDKFGADRTSIKELLLNVVEKGKEGTIITRAIRALAKMEDNDGHIKQVILDRFLNKGLEYEHFVQESLVEGLNRMGVEKGIIIEKLKETVMHGHKDLRSGATKLLSDMLKPEGEPDREAIEQIVDKNLRVLEASRDYVITEGTASARFGAEHRTEYITIDDEVSLPVRRGDKKGVPDIERSKLVHTHTTVDNMKKIMYAAKMNDPLLLIGPTATGKSAPIKYIAAVTNNRHMAISMNPDLTNYEAIGGYKPNTKKGKDQPSVVWEDGFIVKAMEEGYWLTLEELNLAPTEVLELLNFYLVHGYLKIIREGEEVTIKPHKNFRLFATMNPEHYSSRNRLSKALMGRFRCKWFGMLPDGELAEIINVQFGLSQEVGMSLLQMHHLIVKEAKEGDIGRLEKDSYEYNLRDLLRLCNRIKPYITEEGQVPLERVAEEFNKVYLDRIRDKDERHALYMVADNVLKFSKNEIKYEKLISKPLSLDELMPLIQGLSQDEIASAAARPRNDEGDGIDSEKWGQSPVPSGDAFLGTVPIFQAHTRNDEWEIDPTLAPIPTTLNYMKKILQALSMDSRYKEFPLLVGPTATSKTSLVLYLAHLCNVNLHYINLDQDSPIEELIGGYVRTEVRGKYKWKDGLLVKAMREGSWIFIDEFNMSELPEYFNTVIDDGYIILPTGEKVTAEETFRFIGAMNPPEMEGRNILSPALKSRMTEIWIGEELTPDELRDIAIFWATNNTGLDKDILEGWQTELLEKSIDDGNVSLALLKELGIDLFAEAEGGTVLNFAMKATIRESVEETVVTNGLNLTEFEVDRIVARIQGIVKKVRIIARAISDDTRLNFRAGPGWAYEYESNTIIYPIQLLISGKESDECIVGATVHEAAHRDISRVSMRREIFRFFFSKESLRFLLNGFEDPRANNWIMRKFGGSEFYMDALYEKYYPKEEKRADFESKLKVVRSLPHEDYVYGVIYYWRHGEIAPWIKNDKVIQAMEKTIQYFEDIFQTLPDNIRASENSKLVYSADAAQKVKDNILPVYDELVEESIKQIEDAIKNGDIEFREGGDSAGGGAISPEELSEEARKILEKRAKQMADELEGKMQRPDLERAKRIQHDEKTRGDREKQLADDSKGTNAIKSIMDAYRLKQTLRREIEYKRNDYEKVYAKIANMIDYLRGFLENIFVLNTKPKYKGYFPTGKRLDMRKLIQFESGYSDDDRIWKRKKQPRKRDYKFTLLLDESSSMAGEHGQRAIETAVLFLEVLQHVGIDYSILGFSDTANLPIHKAFGSILDEVMKEELLGEIEMCMGNGATADADALKFAIDDIAEQPGERRVVIVLTDGEGNINTTGMSFEEIQEYGAQKGIEIIGVGIGDGISYVKKNYKSSVQVPDIADLPFSIASILEERILSESEVAEKARMGLLNAILAGPQAAGLGFLHPDNDITPEDAHQYIQDSQEVLTNVALELGKISSIEPVLVKFDVDTLPEDDVSLEVNLETIASAVKTLYRQAGALGRVYFELISSSDDEALLRKVRETRIARKIEKKVPAKEVIENSVTIINSESINKLNAGDRFIPIETLEEGEFMLVSHVLLAAVCLGRMSEEDITGETEIGQAFATLYAMLLDKNIDIDELVVLFNKNGVSPEMIRKALGLTLPAIAKFALDDLKNLHESMVSVYRAA